MTKIILAVDSGYGNVKAAWGAEPSNENEIILDQCYLYGQEIILDRNNFVFVT